MKFKILRNTFNNNDPSQAWRIIKAESDNYSARIYYVGDDYVANREKAMAGSDEDRRQFLSTILGDIETKRGGNHHGVQLQFMGGRGCIVPGVSPFYFVEEVQDMIAGLQVALEEATELQQIVDTYLGF